MKQYLLKCEKGHYWIWYRGKNNQPNLIGPLPEPLINYPFYNIKNPLAFKPEEHKRAISRLTW